MAKKWIKGAIKKPGSFRAAAKSRGMSTSQLSAKVAANPSDFSPLMRKRAALARTLSKLRPSHIRNTR